MHFVHRQPLLSTIQLLFKIFPTVSFKAALRKLESNNKGKIFKVGGQTTLKNLLFSYFYEHLLLPGWFYNISKETVTKMIISFSSRIRIQETEEGN